MHTATRCAICSGVSKCGIQLHDTCHICKSSCKIANVLPTEMVKHCGSSQPWFLSETSLDWFDGEKWKHNPCRHAHSTLSTQKFEKAGIFVNSFTKYNIEKLKQKKLLTINYLRKIIWVPKKIWNPFGNLQENF